jgi:5-methyltetrahydrofolate--homocysteine methyltransferase
VKIAPCYDQPVVHVLDASRAVPVTTSLLSAENRTTFVEQHRLEMEQLRRIHAGAKQELISIDAARENRAKIEWRAEDVATPSQTGVRVIDDMSLAKLAEYIDWTPFFHTWELKGVYPRILEHDKYGEAARKLFDEGRQLLEKMIASKAIVARGVWGLFPANAAGDDVELFTDETREATLARFHFLRQQGSRDKDKDKASLSLSDFVAPKATGLRDHLGAFAVTTGLGLKEYCEGYRKVHDDYNAIMAEALADRLAEAFAEYLHEQARIAWGFGASEGLGKEDLIAEKYRGIRPAAGYPACPDHTEKGTLWRLLDVEKNAGISLTESYAMWPGASVSGLYFAHPRARYFTLGKIDKDQVADYAARKGMTVAEVERWLAPNLGYDRPS